MWPKLSYKNFQLYLQVANLLTTSLLNYKDNEFHFCLVLIKLWNMGQICFSDPKKDTKIKLDGKDVVVPQGAPVTQPEYNQKSSFSQSEYLVYKESQNMMRYLVMVDLK